MCPKFWLNFYFEIWTWWGYMPPPPKIWTSHIMQGEVVRNSSWGVQNCKKCVQNYDTMFILKFENGGATCLDPLYQNCNGEYWGRKGCTKFELSCIKLWHNLYFEIRKWLVYMLLLPKFEFRISGKGRVYEIRARFYKILRNASKVLGQYLFWNLKMVELHASITKNLNFAYHAREGCTKFELGCTKL